MEDISNCSNEVAEYFMGDYRSKSKSKAVKRQELQPEEFVQTLVNQNRIVVFSKTHCPHCDNSKSLLSNLGMEFKTVELDMLEQGPEVQNTLGQITDARTVPRIFIDGKCVGGNSDLESLNSTGKLRDCFSE